MSAESQDPAIKEFNRELASLYDGKPPVSKSKMASITKAAMKASRFYKHVVMSVEKFIHKCRPEYKVPGLYVIDALIRQSRRQFGADKDIFAQRFSKNFQSTFQALWQCSPSDRQSIERVLSLWLKAEIFPQSQITPLLQLSSRISATTQAQNSSPTEVVEVETTIPKPSSGSAAAISSFVNNPEIHKMLQMAAAAAQQTGDQRHTSVSKLLTTAGCEYSDEENESSPRNTSAKSLSEAAKSMLGNPALMQQIVSRAFDSAPLPVPAPSSAPFLPFAPQSFPFAPAPNIPGVKPPDDKRDKKKRSRSRSRERKRRRSRSSSRDRSGRKKTRSPNRRSRSSSVERREKDRERRKLALPPIKSKHLSVCSRTLWFGRLPAGCRDTDLVEVLQEVLGSDSSACTAASIDMIPSRGCAYVAMPDRKSALKVLEADRKRTLTVQNRSVKLSWAAGKGVSAETYKEFWEADRGVTYIPWSKLPNDVQTLLDGGMIDHESLPENLKDIPPALLMPASASASLLDQSSSSASSFVMEQFSPMRMLQPVRPLGPAMPPIMPTGLAQYATMQPPSNIPGLPPGFPPGLLARMPPGLPPFAYSAMGTPFRLPPGIPMPPGFPQVGLRPMMAPTPVTAAMAMPVMQGGQPAYAMAAPPSMATMQAIQTQRFATGANGMPIGEEKEEFNQQNSANERGRGRGGRGGGRGCYSCGMDGHMSYDCPQSAGRGRGRGDWRARGEFRGRATFRGRGGMFPQQEPTRNEFFGNDTGPVQDFFSAPPSMPTQSMPVPKQTGGWDDDDADKATSPARRASRWDRPVDSSKTWDNDSETPAPQQSLLGEPPSRKGGWDSDDDPGKKVDDLCELDDSTGTRGQMAAPRSNFIKF